MTKEKTSRSRPADMTTAREVKSLIKAAGMTQQEVADYLTRSLGGSYDHYHVSRMASGNRKVTTGEMDALRELAAAKPDPEKPSESVQLPTLTGTTASVPLYGYANAAGASLRLNEDQRVGAVPIHPAQQGSRGAFAVIVFGDSMAERLNHGETAYAIRNLTPVKDKPCLIEMKGGDTLIKMYVGMDEHTLFARQLHPKKDLSFPLRDVAALHRVVGSTF